MKIAILFKKNHSLSSALARAIAYFWILIKIIDNMSTVAVVFHSGFGHTKVIAKAIAKGAATDAEKVSLIEVSPQGTIKDEEWELLNASDAIVFGAPTYMGSLSGPFKVFMDATSKVWFKMEWKNKIAGGFTNSGAVSGDKLNCLIQLAIFAAQQTMIWVGVDSPSPKHPTPHQPNPEGENRMGSYLGLMAQSENDTPENTPPSGDILTAENYGKRIAMAAKKWR